MIMTLLALIIFAIPFINVFKNKNRGLAFLKILSLSLAFHLFCALITQTLHIFTYWIVLISNLMFASFFIVQYLKNKEKSNFKLKIKWLGTTTFVIIFFALFSVHYFYTGTISSINGSKEVKNSSYAYPTYSDEWVGVAMANYSIENHKLALVNPLNKNHSFANPLVIFHSLMSEFFLFFNITPLTSWSFFSILNGLFICFLLYTLIKSHNISVQASIITILSIPFITNGANLPGIWFLIPFILSFSFFILGLIFNKNKNSYLSGLMLLISILLYPPLIVFVLPTLLAYIYTKHKEEGKIPWKISIYTSLIITIAGIIIFMLLWKASGFMTSIDKVVSWIIRPNLTNGIPEFGIWNIIPFFLIPFIPIGLWILIKKRSYMLLVPITTGGIFWIVYAFFMPVILIEYSRVVVITVLLLMIPAAFGIDYIIKKIILYYPKLNTKRNLNLIIIISILTFSIFFINYPKYNKWQKLVLILKPTTSSTTTSISPASPINRYLNEEDLMIFQNIKGKRFISLPWKGLVIGVATRNIPLESKSSTVNNEALSYNTFIKSTCDEKIVLTKKYKINFIYSFKITCPEFSEIDSSKEGLYLYKYNDPKKR